MRKWKNGSHFIENHSTAKFQITNLPKAWVSTFPSVDRNSKLALAIMKKWKIGISHYEEMENSSLFMENKHTATFQITNPQTVGLHFSEYQWKWEIGVGHFEKNGKMAPISWKIIVQQNSNYCPRQVWISAFLSFEGNGKLVSAIMKNGKMAPISQKIFIQQNFKLPNYQPPQSLGLSFSNC